MCYKQTRTFRVLQVIIHVLARVGALQVLELSEKGRLTQFVERIEPFIRRKFIRSKWFPPVLMAVHARNSPNLAVEEHFARRVIFISRDTHTQLVTALRQNSCNVLDLVPKPIRYLKRPGSPWEFSPSVRRCDDWTVETNALLERMQIAPGTPLVLLAVRDATYYRNLREQQGETAGPETTPETYVRNPDLATYLLAVEQLKARGYAVVYFGFPTSPLPLSLVGKVVDYSGQFRSPRSDLLLGRYCTMMMSGGSGAWALVSLFNRPVAFSNSYIPFVGGYSKRDRAIFQLLQDTRVGRILTFQEMARTKGAYSYQSNCDRDGVSLVKNNAEEICELALEVIDRKFGQFESRPGDGELLRKFAVIQAELPTYNGRMSLPGVMFLRRHAHLLD